jgi:hypothetical protein
MVVICFGYGLDAAKDPQTANIFERPRTCRWRTLCTGPFPHRSSSCYRCFVCRMSNGWDLWNLGRPSFHGKGSYSFRGRMPERARWGLVVLRRASRQWLSYLVQEGCLCARTVGVLAVFVVVFLGWLRPRVTKLPDVWSGAGFVPLLCTEADSYRLMIDAGWAPH